MKHKRKLLCTLISCKLITIKKPSLNTEYYKCSRCGRKAFKTKLRPYIMMIPE